MKKRKVTTALLSMGLMATFWCSDTSAASFSDVSEKNSYYNIIELMTSEGVINGFEDGTFKPNQSISRKHAAALINRAIDVLPISEESKPAPKDLSRNNPNYNDLMTLYAADLLELDSKGNINPNAPLTRGEMAKIIAVAFGLEGDKHPLTDVSKDIEEYVSALYENNVTTGYEDGTFRENEPLTRAHYAVFLHRAQNPEGVNNELEDNNSQENNSSEDVKTISDAEFKKLTNEEVADLVVPFSNDYYAETIPLPPGKKDATSLTNSLQGEYNSYFVANKMNLNMTQNFSSISTWKAHSLFTDYYNVILDCSSIEAVELVNRAYETGELITNENAGINTDVVFAIYFDYNLGNLHLGLLNE